MTKWIDWKKLTPTMKIKLKGKKGSQFYEANGAIVTWTSREARKAQAYLKKLVGK